MLDLFDINNDGIVALVSKDYSNAANANSPVSLPLTMEHNHVSLIAISHNDLAHSEFDSVCNLLGRGNISVLLNELLRLVREYDF